MPDSTYIDRYIADGQKAVISLPNLYDTILVGDVNNENHIYRIPYNDFFLKHRSELESIIELYSLPESMYYKPKLLSFEIYDTTELWLAILRVNGMKSVTEFHCPIIRLYNPASLKEMIKIFFKREKKM